MALVPYEVQKALTPAGLRAAACQSQGLLRIPPRLQAAIESFLGEYPTRELKLSVSRLSEAMRKTKLALQQEEDPQAPREQDAESTTPNKWQKKEHFRRQLFNKYKEHDTCAYVAARLPAVYSAVYRVLIEVCRRLPDFKPSHVMDYGSGPGTAIWALCEVWPEAIKHVNIVEPSEAMSYARRSLFQAMKNHLPDIRNFDNIEGFARQVRPADRVHNLVIASYSLGELKTPEERISVTRQLWGLTTDILVIIEPGSPRGSSIVRELRSHILCMENKRLWRQKKKHDASEAQKGSMFCIEEPKEKVGAFVVAPCAHNGVCPMDGTEKFCHFSQRLERSSSQLLFKRQKGRALRGYEDEKFSFVVLRKGSRPRMEWPLDRVDQRAFDEAQKKNPNFYGVIIEEPEDFDEVDDDQTEVDENNSGEEDEGSGNVNGNRVVQESSEEENRENEVVEESSEDDRMDNDVAEESNEEGSTENEEEHEELEEDADEPLADMGSGWGRILFLQFEEESVLL